MMLVACQCDIGFGLPHLHVHLQLRSTDPAHPGMIIRDDIPQEAYDIQMSVPWKKVARALVMG
jgi:hypothetical protein